MAATEHTTNDSGTPAIRRGVGGYHISRKSDDISSFIHKPLSKDGRSLSNSSLQNGHRMAFAALSGSVMPGSFNSDLKSAMPARSGTPRPDLAPLTVSRLPSGKEDDGPAASEQRQALVRSKIAKEMKIKLGTENMLEALLAKNAKQTKDQRLKVENELGTSNRKIAELKLELDQEILRANSPTTPPSNRMTSYFRGSPLKSPPQIVDTPTEEPTPFEGESPTVVLADILQALELEGMQPDYYIERANTLVELFKRNPTLKYDIAWSAFSLRVQIMLLSDSPAVVAAGYRLTRYAITDRSSIKTIRALHTDELVVLSLVKKGKAILEREQAIKFIRAFLDVKDGVREIAPGVLRTIVAAAEHAEDKLKNICVLTLSEVLMKHPQLLVEANGINAITETLANGSYPASESLVAAFLHILDVPSRRKYLKSGREFEAMFAPFTDPLALDGNEENLRTCAKAISAMVKTWPGFLTLLHNDAAALRSLLESLQYPNAISRDLILELIFDVLRIKTPTWSSTFLAGRRLTTYGRVNMMTEEPSATQSHKGTERDDHRIDLTSHFSALILATLVNVGLVQALYSLVHSEDDSAIKRKATLLLTEILRLANNVLPPRISSQLQVLGRLISTPEGIQSDQQATNTAMIYQIDSINRTVNRSSAQGSGRHGATGELAVGPQAVEKSKLSPSMNGDLFRQALLESQVPGHTQYMKWKWDVVHNLIEGPLSNPKRLDEAIRSSKFVKRVMSFYCPFKYRFSVIRNTRPNQRYIRTGCALMRTLAQTSMGLQYLAESKLLRQMAECLAQVDRHSGLTSATPMFDRHQMAETLSGGYFAMIGALTASANGLAMMERWHMMNMFYHIIDLRDREDLIRALLNSLDYSIDSHLRVLLSRSLTSAPKAIRLVSTRILRSYCSRPGPRGSSNDEQGSNQWALRLVLTQLYDPDIEVGETAVRVLEEACNESQNLDYVVKCRPSLDHLGEIGAPLLLRFLSTSVGYHYLNGLDYITQEMDDWFLGRNDSYVALVETSLAQAYIDQTNPKGLYGDDPVEFYHVGLVPPHFYRELARTSEGCKLLRQSGHFLDFASTIGEFELEEEDLDILTRVKGCLWAVGNVGSMELGAPFLEESEIVEDIVRIAQRAEVLSMRGTAYFVLGLISRSLHGYEMLADSGWESAMDSRGRSLGFCLPGNLSSLCSVRFAHQQPTKDQYVKRAQRLRSATTDSDPIQARILKSIVEMGNSVMFKKAVGELRLLKSKYAEVFKRVSLFQKTLVILESHHYKMQPRQFILDLFDKGVLRQVVLEEESTEEDLTGSDTG